MLKMTIFVSKMFMRFSIAWKFRAQAYHFDALVLDQHDYYYLIEFHCFVPTVIGP